MSEWTDKEDAALRAMSLDGASASVIGKALGRTKSAVIGRAHRKGIRLALSTEGRRSRGKAQRGQMRSVAPPSPGHRLGTWSGLVVEPWSERKARRERERILNDDELPETGRWAADFAFETPRSLRAALGVLAGRLNDPELFRHVADRLDDMQRGRITNRPQGRPQNNVENVAIRPFTNSEAI